MKWLKDPSISIGFSKGKVSYTVGSRYNGLFIPRKIIEVEELLVDAGYIEPETLSYQITLFGPIGADVRQMRRADYVEHDTIALRQKPAGSHVQALPSALLVCGGRQKRLASVRLQSGPLFTHGY